MGRLVWNEPSNRRLLGGTDRGVLYLPRQAAVPWNGITSVVQSSTADTDSIYFDGRRIAVDITPGPFEGTLSAFNYPPEFERAQGFEQVRPGVYANSQKPCSFGLTYRTQVRNAIGAVIGHKIHLFWDLKATPSDVTHNTLGGDPDVSPFEWSLAGAATELPKIRPTGHLVLDTTEIDPWLIEDVENLIYGSMSDDPELPPLKEFYEWMMNWARFYVVDNGNGTWTGTEARSGHIFPQNDGTLLLDAVKVTFLDEDTFLIENTYNAMGTSNVDVVEIDDIVSINTSDPDTIVNNHDGTVTLNDMDLVAYDGGDILVRSTNNPR